MNVVTITFVDTVLLETTRAVELIIIGEGVAVVYAVTTSVIVVGRTIILVEVMYVVVAEPDFAVHLHRRRFEVAPTKASGEAVRLTNTVLPIVLVALTVTETVDLEVVVHAGSVMLDAMVEVNVEFM